MKEKKIEEKISEVKFEFTGNEERFNLFLKNVIKEALVVDPIQPEKD